MAKSQNLLTEVESKALLKKAGIPVVEAKLARSKKEAISISNEMGFPVVLKVSSTEVVHKSDSGGVKLGLTNATQVGKAYNEILSSIKQAYPQAQIEGVSVQSMAPSGVEVIVGMSKDPQFGPVLMFGLGGILVEVLKDVSFRIVPVTARDAKAMIREIKGYPVLEGYRGQKPASIPALEKLIVKVSQFVEKNPQIRELDLNPIFAYPDKAVAVDARIILE
ncbi:MAG: acetate--CoA ligase family protein [Chloroflexota bacterium]|nr:MAG: acetate--CoA ligase family protein [Chloroflexota bacterium]